MESTNNETPSCLTQAELGTLRAVLEQLRSELLARLQREQRVAIQAEKLTEPMDAAEQTREQDDAILFTERDRTMLREVEHALAKF